MCDAERKTTGDRVRGLQSAHDDFYLGETAQRIAAFYSEQGGFLTLSDLAAIDVPIESAKEVRVHGHRFFAGGVWGQGVSFLQALRMLEHADIASMRHNSAEHIHLLVEVTKIVAADRELYCGDPNYVGDATAMLLSAEYTDRRRALLSPTTALSWPQYSDPTAALPRSYVGEGDNYATTYLGVADRWGNVFAATPSDGSRHGPVVPGTGLSPSGRGATSTTLEGHPAEVMPGKRPRMMTGPLFAKLSDGRHMTFGSPGADTQMQANIQFLCNHLLFGMDLQSAVEAPRFSSFGFPGSFAPQAIKPQVVKVEESIPAATRDALATKGHIVEAWADRAWMAGSVSAVVHQPTTGLYQAAADPRRMAYGIAG